MTLRVDDFSKYRETDTILQDGEEVFGRWVEPDLLVRELGEDQFQVFVVNNTRAGRPDLIALEFYGTTQLDWFLIAFNKQRDVFNWPRAGDVIKIPIPSLVISELL